MRIEAFFEREQYSLPHAEKEAMLVERLGELTRHHAEHCDPYRRILAALGRDTAVGGVEDVPMLPVGLFKSHELRSIPQSGVFKVVSSSGTTGAAVSRVYLDAPSAHRQTRALASIMTHWIGRERLPMIIVDSRAALGDRKAFSARGAGIIGMATFGRTPFYALDADMQLDREGLRAWLDVHAGSPILIFGFTFMVWEHLLQQIQPGEFALDDAVLVHSGGWKKLIDKAVDNRVFRSELERIVGVRRVHNMYGMAEQIGTVLMECDHGIMHTPNIADVVVRDPADWRPVGVGETGVVQMVSALPESYPGHSILTEDLARLETIDDCPCGRMGKGVTLLGRVPKAELRGCSDTHAQSQELAA